MNLSTLKEIHRELVQRFDGWPERATGEPVESDELQTMLPSPPELVLCIDNPQASLSIEQLIQLCRVWERCDCFIWAARSHRAHRDWDPLVESFASFEAADPHCALYTLGLDPICPESTVQQILGFILIQAALHVQSPPSDPLRWTTSH